MKKFMIIAKKNLKTQFRDKKALLMTILVPILFYCIMGMISMGTESTEHVTVYNIGWVDLDHTESGDPVKNLDSIKGIIDDLEQFELSAFENIETATSELQDKNINAYVILPEGFELYINGTGARPEKDVEFYFRDSTEVITKNIISSSIINIIDGIVNNNENEIELYHAEQTITGNIINQMTMGTPGYLLYGILSSLSTSVILLTSEKKTGILRRLESSRMKANDMILGSLVSNTATVLIQFTIGITILSLFGFNPNYFNIVSLVFGVILTVILLSFLQNALSMIVSAIFRTPEAAPGGMWLILIPLMTFSGGFFPLEIVAPNLIPYVGWIPTRIVVILFQDIMINSVSLWNLKLLIEFSILVGEGLLLHFLGIKLYKRFVQF